jgi:hypothetical protein
MKPHHRRAAAKDGTKDFAAFNASVFAEPLISWWRIGNVISLL